MRWRGQGVLTAVVLATAGAYAFQWRSINGMTEEIEANGLPLAPYVQAVSVFVDKERRFPQPGELILPTPPKGGLFRRVDLREGGELDFTMSARTLSEGHVRFVLAPSVMPGAGLPGQNRLHYTCVEVRPATLERELCRGGLVTREELAQSNRQAFAKWQAHSERLQHRAVAIEAAEHTITECDRLAAHARDAVVPCIANMNSEAGEQFDRAIDQALLARRLRPEYILDSPEALDQFNDDCQSTWGLIVGQQRAATKRFDACFVPQR